MTCTSFTLRRAAALLLTAVALPLTPALGQTETLPDPVVDFSPPSAVPQPVETVTPVQTQAPAPAAAAPEPASEPVAQTPEPAVSAPRRVSRTVPRTPARNVTPARAAPVQAAAPAAPVSAPASTPAPAPAAEATPPPAVISPAAEAPPAAPQEGASPNLFWIVLGALALAAFAGFFLLRRRRTEYHDEAFYAPTAAHDEADMAPVAAIPVDEAAPVDAGRPALDLDLRPRRAGVSGDEAVVEFELDVANHGSAVARDVRVSTWMIPAGSATEKERALIERPQGDSLNEIEAGSGESIARTVTLDTRGVDSDAVLPVIVAEARYTLPDGTEARTSASYAVGVPDGEELAHFAIDNPSGLHDEVIARELGEPERA